MPNFFTNKKRKAFNNTKANAKNFLLKGVKKQMAKQSLVPQAREALDKFKMEAASEVGVNLKNGYNGDLTSKQAGSVGGQMVNNICPERQRTFKREYRQVNGHEKQFTYRFRLTV